MISIVYIILASLEKSAPNGMSLRQADGEEWVLFHHKKRQADEWSTAFKEAISEAVASCVKQNGRSRLISYVPTPSKNLTALATIWLHLVFYLANHFPRWCYPELKWATKPFH